MSLLLKNCRECGIGFAKPINRSRKSWETAFFCSYECKNKSTEVRTKISQSRKGMRFTEEHRRNIGIAGLGRTPWNKGEEGPRGEESPNWKGDGAGYGSKHQWLSNIFGDAKKYPCMFCGDNPGGRKMVWANLDGKYSRDLQSWTTLCQKCNVNYDKVMAQAT